ncbi:hypothetical protein L1987_78201 [Smallanthus sonchifolius]|uniref:Uncharacterized protein n=1 Tax=Smallanthus sonchifolius TaxID=185202 RepID=A0ACB8ZC05_9ASTR|nr:hypothetical protein L1987_78201 [Smallanthus sonchifolius]
MDFMNWVLLILIIFSVKTLSQTCHPDDLSALKEIAAGFTNGSGLSSWSSDSICCHWHGVVCENDVKNVTRVTILNLSEEGLKGVISHSASRLRNLGLIDLSLNQLEGELPKNLSSLKNLEVVNVSSNLLSGNLFGFGGFPNLVAFYLSNNSFSGEFEPKICNLSNNLWFLDISMNHFTGSLEGGIPEFMYSFSSLKRVSLSSNSFYGELSANLSKLSNLESLMFTNLPLALSVLQNCKNLTTLILTKNFHGEEIPVIVNGFERLMVLAIANCGLKGQIPHWLTDCPKLEVLDISWNHLNGVIPSWIGQMERLFYLDFSNNSLTGQLPKSLTDLRSLVSLNISSSILGSTTGIPLYVKRNQSGRGLQYNPVASFPPSIYLSNNKLNGTILPEIGKLKQLHVLDLSKNNLSGTIPDTISEMGNLEVLDLSSNNLSGLIPVSLTKLTFLSMFSVANNHLEGAIPTGTHPSSSFEGNPGLCGESLPPCGVKTIPSLHSASHRKLGRNRIFGITLGIRAGLAILLACIVIKILRKRQRDSLRESEDESNSMMDGLSGGFNRSKAVFFLTCGCRDLMVSNIVEATNNFSESNIISCGGFRLFTKLIFQMGQKQQSRDFQVIVVKWNASFMLKLKPYQEPNTRILFPLKARRAVEVGKGKNCRNLVSWVFEMKVEGRYGEIFDFLIWDKSYENEMLQVLSIACKCLDKDPRRRPTIDHIVLWLDEVVELGS